MRIVIAGAGSVGTSIARELIRNDHQVLLIDKETSPARLAPAPKAAWLQADACEISALEEAGLATCDVVVGATGDDKVNLVLSLLAKTEFAVPRTVARVNNPRNEWMFDESWGVDVAVSPRLMTALSRAVSVGDLVRIFTFHKGGATMVAHPAVSPYAGARVGDVPLPADTVLVGIIREQQPLAHPDDTRAARAALHDDPDVELDLEPALPGHHKRDPTTPNVPGTSGAGPRPAAQLDRSGPGGSQPMTATRRPRPASRARPGHPEGGDVAGE